MRKPFPSNNFCPCNSGVKYKKCCQPKGVDYYLRDGKVVREEALLGEQRADFEKQKQDFLSRYGRKPTEEEEGLMRISAGNFVDLNLVIEKDLIKRGAPDEVVYAFRKTGILVSPENHDQISVSELQKWESAIDEYRRSKSGA
jgi:uncharacterized protein YchJ